MSNPTKVSSQSYTYCSHKFFNIFCWLCYIFLNVEIFIKKNCYIRKLALFPDDLTSHATLGSLGLCNDKEFSPPTSAQNAHENGEKLIKRGSDVWPTTSPFIRRQRLRVSIALDLIWLSPAVSANIVDKHGLDKSRFKSIKVPDNDRWACDQNPPSWG